MITTAEEVRLVRAIAINVNPNVIEPYIEDVEKQDVLPTIGASLYFAIDGDRNNEAYKDFLHGARFKDCHNCDAYSRGLIMAVAYLTYARMIESSGIQVTAYGVVKKEVPYSTNISDADGNKAAISARKIGLAILGDCVKHARVLFGNSCLTQGVTERHNKFVAIKKGKL